MFTKGSYKMILDVLLHILTDLVVNHVDNSCNGSLQFKSYHRICFTHLAFLNNLIQTVSSKMANMELSGITLLVKWVI